MTYELNTLFSLSIGIGAIAGWVRIKKIDPAFLPYLIWLGISFLHEIYSYIITEAGYSNVVSFNLFILIEMIIINWQFKRWGLFERKKTLYYIIIVMLIISWLGEFVFRGDLLTFDSYFIILSSAIVVLLSISMLNRIMFTEPRFLLSNPVFLICMGMVIFFTYSILVEAFWLYGLNKSRQFRIQIYEILAYINLFTNLIYGLATIWIPLKPRYILRY